MSIKLLYLLTKYFFTIDLMYKDDVVKCSLTVL